MTCVEAGPELADETAPAERPDGGSSQFARWGVTTQDVLVLTAGVLFCAGAGPFTFGGWTPRMAALLAGLPLGVVLLARLAWRRDKAAIAAVGFLVWALISALASTAPWRSILGQVDGNTQSVVLFAGTFGFWALARALSDRGRALVGPVVVGALGVSAFVGVLQILLDIQHGTLATVSGRASGLEGNAVYFSTTMCGAVAWCASQAIAGQSARSRRISIAAVAFFAFAIGLSGSRVSIIAVLAVSGAVCWWAKRLSSLRVPLAVLVGLVSSLAMQRSVGQIGTDSVGRFSAAGSEGRPALWRAGLSAIADRPILGSGPGRARPAVQRYFTPDFVRLYQKDDFVVAWHDVHNVVLQMLITVGIIGVVLLTLFVVFAMRRADFGLSLAAVAISINWLLQPASMSSLAVAAVFLGASGTRVAMSLNGTSVWPRVVTGSAAALGVAAALYLVAADLNLRHAIQSRDAAAMRTAAGWFGEDPLVIDVFVLGSYKPGVPEDRAARMDAARRAVAAEPDVPTWWNELAMTQWESGDFEGFRASVEKALELQPNHYRSWVQLTAYAKHVGNTELEEIARTHACDLGAPVCAPT